MKIVHCFFTMNTGGAQMLAVDLLNKMSAEHRVSLIVVNNKWNNVVLNQLDKKIKVYLINRKERSNNPVPILRFNLLLLMLRPDIVHSHEDKLVKLIKIGGYKTVFTVHGIGHTLSAIRSYSSVVAISETVKIDIFSRYNINSSVIYNGIDLNKFDKRQDYSFKISEGFRLVQVSRLVHDIKGQDILILALNKLIYEYKIVNIKLDLVGDGESRSYLEALRDKLGMTGFVNFLGDKDRRWIGKNLSKYHILVQPSRVEGFGLTVVEGIAALIPVVASNNNGPAEIMNDFPRKYLFDIESVDHCALMLLKVIEDYKKGKIKQIVDGAYTATSAKFSLDSTVTQYLAHYKRLMQ